MGGYRRAMYSKNKLKRDLNHSRRKHLTDELRNDTLGLRPVKNTVEQWSKDMYFSRPQASHRKRTTRQINEDAALY